MNLSHAIEALLFSAHKPLSAKEIVDVLRNAGAEDDFEPNEFANVKPTEVAAAIEQLKVEYIQNEHGFQLAEKAGGWQLASDPRYAQWIRGLFPPSRSFTNGSARTRFRAGLWRILSATSPTTAKSTRCAATSTG